MGAYIHNVQKGNDSLGKIGALILLKADDKNKANLLQPLSDSLAMHLVAMKPNYFVKSDVPETVLENSIDKTKGDYDAKVKLFFSK